MEKWRKIKRDSQSFCKVILLAPLIVSTPICSLHPLEVKSIIEFHLWGHALYIKVNMKCLELFRKPTNPLATMFVMFSRYVSPKSLNFKLVFYLSYSSKFSFSQFFSLIGNILGCYTSSLGIMLHKKRDLSPSEIGLNDCH
jgi:hypothetical protein